MARCLFCGVVSLLLSLPVAAGDDFDVDYPGGKVSLEIRGKTKKHGELRVGKQVIITAEGPKLINVRVRQPLQPGQRKGQPVRLSVIADGEPWTSMEIALKEDRHAQGPVASLVSVEKLFQIDVPEGLHTYVLQTSGKVNRALYVRVTKTGKAKPSKQLKRRHQRPAEPVAADLPLVPLAAPAPEPEPEPEPETAPARTAEPVKVSAAPAPAAAPPEPAALTPAPASEPAPAAAPAREAAVQTEVIEARPEGSGWKHAAGKIKMAVMDIAAKGAPKDVAESITGVVATELGNLGPFSVISSQEILTMLSFEQDKQMHGCADASCLAEIGGALGAEYLVSGTVSQLGETFVLGLQLMNINQAKVEARESREVAGDPAALVEQGRGAARRLVAGLLKLASGYLVIRVNESEAEIKVDGDLVGVSPLRRLELPGGPHTVKVSKQGFIVWARDVDVPPGETAVAEVTLIPSPEFVEQYQRKAKAYRVLAWVGTGVGVLAAGAGFGLLIAQEGRRKDLADDIKAFNNGTAPEGVDRDGLSARQESLDSDYLGYQIIGYAGLAFLAAAAYFWIAGDDPGKYQEFRAQEKTAGAPQAPQWFLGAAPSRDGGSAVLGWRF